MQSLVGYAGAMEQTQPRLEACREALEETTIDHESPQEALAIVTCSTAAKSGKITNAFAQQLSQLLVLLFEATQKVVDKDGVAAIKELAGAPVFSDATFFPFDVTIANLHLVLGTMQQSYQEYEKYVQWAAACVDLSSNVTWDTVRALEKVSDTLHGLTSESNDQLQLCERGSSLWQQ